MAEYIERDAALRGWPLCDEPADAYQYIRSYPAADVRPVRHGRWGVKNECSECGCQPWFERDIHTLNFCPNCGADMREES